MISSIEPELMQSKRNFLQLYQKFSSLPLEAIYALLACGFVVALAEVSYVLNQQLAGASAFWFASGFLVGLVGKSVTKCCYSSKSSF
jgi:hypothetical protein